MAVRPHPNGWRTRSTSFTSRVAMYSKMKTMSMIRYNIRVAVYRGDVLPETDLFSAHRGAWAGRLAGRGSRDAGPRASLALAGFHAHHTAAVMAHALAAVRSVSRERCARTQGPGRLRSARTSGGSGDGNERLYDLPRERRAAAGDAGEGSLRPRGPPRS